jgi:nucleotide-binding universal stress UspA family protein
MSGATTPMPGSIICAVDGSKPAKGAIRVARDLSALLQRRLVFVRVVEPGTPPERIDAIAARLRGLADGENHRGHASALWLVDVGHAADRLVAAAEDEQASLIVLGSHGPRSSLLGSISAEVSRRAPCPVVVVPPAANSAANGDRQLAGGIARFSLGTTDGDTDLAGGIARFDLAAAARSRNDKLARSAAPTKRFHAWWP